MSDTTQSVEKPYEYIIREYRLLLGQKEKLDSLDKEADLGSLNKSLLGLKRPDYMKGDDYRPVAIHSWKREDFRIDLARLHDYLTAFKNVQKYLELQGVDQ